MELKKVSESEKSAARKNGKIPTAPKKPKKGATLAALEKYVERHNAYVEKVKKLAAKGGKRDALKKKIFG